MPPISIDIFGLELYASDAKCPCKLYIKFQSEKRPGSINKRKNWFCLRSWMPLTITVAPPRECPNVYIIICVLFCFCQEQEETMSHGFTTCRFVITFWRWIFLKSNFTTTLNDRFIFQNNRGTMDIYLQGIVTSPKMNFK